MVWRLATAIFVLGGCTAGHPCESEVASACPDRPGADIAGCLKDPDEHESPTTISSECTDFIALNKACSAEIQSICDDAFFSGDTVLCLTQWASPDQLSQMCTSVMEWAIPKPDENEEGPTDELGLSEKDYEEKKEWQRKRREARGDAIERLKMKEADRKKEEDRVALEQFKKQDPEGYAQMITQQKEEKRQQEEFRRIERQRAAALERKRKEELGITDDEEDARPEKKKKKSKVSKDTPETPSSSPLTAAFCFLFLVVVCAGAYFMVSRLQRSEAKKVRRPKKK